jgi:fatty acid desaturase
MDKLPLDYRSSTPDPEASGVLGFVALNFSFGAVGLSVILLMGILCRYKVSTILGDHAENVVAAVLGVAAAASLVASVVLGTIASFDGGRSREMGLCAIVLSATWFWLILVLIATVPM